MLRLIEQKGLRMHNLHLQDNKLSVKASAGTETQKNEVWNQIKLVDPNYADLTCEIGIDPSLAPSSEPGVEAKPTGTNCVIRMRYRSARS